MVAAISPGDFQDIRHAQVDLKRNGDNQITQFVLKSAELNSTRLKLDGLLRRSALATYALNRVKALRAAPTSPTKKHNKTPDLPPDDLARARELLAATFSTFPTTHPNVVLYLPELDYQTNGHAEATLRSTESLDTVVRASRQHNIAVIDATDALIQRYASEGQPGHGFANTSIISGHLNDAGHRVVAQLLSKWLHQ